ncbi:hypothetical protein D3C80_1653190 [compost metagenome]
MCGNLWILIKIVASPRAIDFWPAVSVAIVPGDNDAPARVTVADLSDCQVSCRWGNVKRRVVINYSVEVPVVNSQFVKIQYYNFPRVSLYEL